MRIVHVTVAPSTGAPLFKQAEETQITIKKLSTSIDAFLNTMSCELFDCYPTWFGGFLMIQKVGEINLFVTTFVNKTTIDSFGLFHQPFEPLKIHQTTSNGNQTIHQTLYVLKMDKSGPKNNNFGSLIWKGGSGVLTTISVGFRDFPKLSRYLYDHKAIKLAARYHKFELKQFKCLSSFISYRPNIT